VLVVEDAPLVRALAADVLEEVGFVVLEAPTADYALAVLEKPEDICVLLTDVDMLGRLNGFQLARIVQDHFHRVRVIIVSGKARPDRDDIAPHAIFIPKPYKLTEIGPDGSGPCMPMAYPWPGKLRRTVTIPTIPSSSQPAKAPKRRGVRAREIWLRCPSFLYQGS
jgi:two-component system, response regulator PdtaR